MNQSNTKDGERNNKVVISFLKEASRNARGHMDTTQQYFIKHEDMNPRQLTRTPSRVVKGNSKDKMLSKTLHKLNLNADIDIFPEVTRISSFK